MLTVSNLTALDPATMASRETIFAPGVHNAAVNWYNDGMVVSNISHSAVVTAIERDVLRRETARIDGRGNETVIGVAGTNVIERFYDEYGRNAGCALNGNRRSSATYNEKGEAQTSTYVANNLNQYTTRTTHGYAAVRGEADPNAVVTVNENPIVSTMPILLADGCCEVINQCDSRHRRVREVVRPYMEDACPLERSCLFVWKEDNIVAETISFADGVALDLRNTWRPDVSGSEHGAGGVGGLLAVDGDDDIYMVCYGNIGSVISYVSWLCEVEARYDYDTNGSVIKTDGDKCSVLNDYDDPFFPYRSKGAFRRVE